MERGSYTWDSEGKCLCLDWTGLDYRMSEPWVLGSLVFELAWSRCLSSRQGVEGLERQRELLCWSYFEVCITVRLLPILQAKHNMTFPYRSAQLTTTMIGKHKQNAATCFRYPT